MTATIASAWAPDGRSRWVEARGQVQSGADGKPARMIGTLTDITPRKEAEEATAGLLRDVNATRLRLQSLAQNAPAFVCNLRGPRLPSTLARPRSTPATAKPHM